MFRIGIGPHGEDLIVRVEKPEVIVIKVCGV